MIVRIRNKADENKLTLQLMEIGKRKNLVRDMFLNSKSRDTARLLNIEEFEGILNETIARVVIAFSKKKKYDDELVEGYLITAYKHNILKEIAKLYTDKRDNDVRREISLQNITEGFKENSNLEAKINDSLASLEMTNPEQALMNKEREEKLRNFLYKYQTLQNSRFGKKIPTGSRCVVATLYDFIREGHNIHNLKGVLNVSEHKVKSAKEDLAFRIKQFYKLFPEYDRSEILYGEVA